jgi:hypothetical protein
MSTAVATQPIHHTITWGTSTWVCTNPYCDGTHHVYSSCEH